MRIYPVSLMVVGTLGFAGCSQDDLRALNPPVDEVAVPDDDVVVPGDTDEPTDEEPSCPDEVVSTSVIDANSDTTLTLQGTLPDADGDATFEVRGADDAEVSGPIAVDSADAYDVIVPLFCGEQEVRVEWTSAGCPQARVYQVTTSNCRPAEIRVTLTWDDLGRDWELHLIRPGGSINDDDSDCTWTSCINGSPDWGRAGDASDDPHKDIDDTDSFGPENIYLNEPENGTYWVLVEHWNTNGDDHSDGSAQLNVGGSLTVLDIADLATWHVRYVATIDWPSGVVTPLTDTYDCSDSWNEGCRAPLP